MIGYLSVRMRFGPQATDLHSLLRVPRQVPKRSRPRLVADRLKPWSDPQYLDDWNGRIVKRHPELPPLRHVELPPPSGYDLGEGCFRR
jgi:hypothetical protein